MEIIIFLLSLFGLYKTEPVSTPIPTPTPSKHVLPIDNFDQRITKKPFGINVNETRFKGFHTGTDIEYEDVESDVEVYSIADGTVIYSGYVSGYGGFVAIQHEEFIGIYGHLRPSTLINNKSFVAQGQQIGVLGTTFSKETDNERRHLHFAILKGTKLDFRGYVQKENELTAWIDPLTLFNQIVDSQR